MTTATLSSSRLLACLVRPLSPEKFHVRTHRQVEKKANSTHTDRWSATRAMDLNGKPIAHDRAGKINLGHFAIGQKLEHAGLQSIAVLGDGLCFYRAAAKRLGMRLSEFLEALLSELESKTGNRNDDRDEKMRDTFLQNVMDTKQKSKQAEVHENRKKIKNGDNSNSRREMVKQEQQQQASKRKGKVGQGGKKEQCHSKERKKEQIRREAKENWAKQKRSKQANCSNSSSRRAMGKQEQQQQAMGKQEQQQQASERKGTVGQGGKKEQWRRRSACFLANIDVSKLQAKKNGAKQEQQQQARKRKDKADGGGKNGTKQKRSKQGEAA